MPQCDTSTSASSGARGGTSSSRTAISPSPRYTAAGMCSGITGRSYGGTGGHRPGPPRPDTTKPPAPAGGFERNAKRNSDHADVLCLVALAPRGHVELDVLALFERLVAVALNVRVVDEDVLLSLERDEPV